MKSCFVRNITPYSSLKVNRRFTVTYRFQLHGQRVVQEKKLAWSTDCCPLYSRFLPGLLFSPEDGDVMFLRNICWHSPYYTPCFRPFWIVNSTLIFTYTNVTVLVSSEFILKTRFGAHLASYPKVPGAIYLEVKWPGHEADRLPPCRA
jgi:hypothetical protein